MGWGGLILLALALGLMMSTGWPTWVVLVGVSSVGAVAGLALQAFDVSLLSSLPARMVGLLEQDLLQALALYAVVGALLHHLALADGLYAGLRKLLARAGLRGSPVLAGLGLGLLMAPMNGSVGASLMTVSRTAGARWAEEGMPPARRAVLVAVTSTLGVIVPPSLVLLLLGDAMMRAHTEGMQLAEAGSAAAAARVVNTQDVLQAALVPGAMVFLCWVVAAWFAAGRAEGREKAEPLTPRERWIVGIVPAAIAALLGLVAAGRVRAVEAAAAAGVALLAWGFASGALLRGGRLRRVLDDAMALTGALFALLVAATSFSLVLRAFGTDALVAGWMAHFQGHPLLALSVMLGVLLCCSFVLDAFELIFLVVPIMMPPLLALVDDAAWVAALTLLVLQAGFLLPPFGYAMVLARGQIHPRPPVADLWRALWPFLASLVAVIAIVVALPQTTQWSRAAPIALPAPELSPEEIDEQLRQMTEPAPEPAAPPAPTQ
ncbi:MAG: TRAP transporter large permease subunit [Proteobacteria bacterium]|nr:TRAP transporter large permease subunit [Pseudomonadota bacterium]